MLANEILEHYNITDGVPKGGYSGPQLLSEFVGQNFRGMMGGLEKKHDFTIPPAEFDAYVSRELDSVIANLRKKALPCEGVIPVLDRLQASKKYHLAIVSSSAMPRVVASIEVTDMEKYFEKADVGIFSAASSLNPPNSKPDPAIYLHACKELGYKPSECVAIEDSRSGATAAMRAQIPTIGYVGPYLEEGQEKQDQMIKVLGEDCKCFAVMKDWSEFEGIMEKYESGALKSKY